MTKEAKSKVKLLPLWRQLWPVVWRQWWPLALLLAALAILLVGRSLSAEVPRGKSQAEDLLPILVPATRFYGGTALLASDRWIAVAVMAPDDKGTPIPAAQTYARVEAMIGGQPVVVQLAVPTGEAVAMQAALLNEKASLIYRSLAATPTPTATPTVGPTVTMTPTPDPAVPTATPLPGKERVYWSLPGRLSVIGLDRVRPGTPARLVIVTAPVPVAGTPMPLPPFAACVRLVASSPTEQASFDGVLLELPAAEVAQAIQAAVNASRIELVPDFSCKFE